MTENRNLSLAEQHRAGVTAISNKALADLAEKESRRVSKAELEQMQAIYDRQVQQEQENLISFLVTHGREVNPDEPVYTKAQANAAVEQAREQWATESREEN
jgi:hypothetical protein